MVAEVPSFIVPRYSTLLKEASGSSEEASVHCGGGMKKRLIVTSTPSAFAVCEVGNFM